MTDRIFAIHTPESASTEGRAALERLRTAVGLVPNLAATMAESPELLNGFLTLRELYAQTGFSPAQIQVLSLVAAYENRCAWSWTWRSKPMSHHAMSRSSKPEDRSRAARWCSNWRTP